MNKPLYVTAKFRVKKEKLSEISTVLAKFSSDTLCNEEGCIAYIYLQDTEDETLFTSSEIWQNAEAESLHWDTPHLKELLAKLPEYLDGEAEVNKWNRI